jgi:hypothetical protein
MLVGFVVVHSEANSASCIRQCNALRLLHPQTPHAVVNYGPSHKTILKSVLSGHTLNTTSRSTSLIVSEEVSPLGLENVPAVVQHMIELALTRWQERGECPNVAGSSPAPATKKCDAPSFGGVRIFYCRARRDSIQVEAFCAEIPSELLEFSKCESRGPAPATKKEAPPSWGRFILMGRAEIRIQAERCLRRPVLSLDGFCPRYAGNADRPTLIGIFFS